MVSEKDLAGLIQETESLGPDNNPPKQKKSPWEETREQMESNTRSQPSYTTNIAPRLGKENESAAFALQSYANQTMLPKTVVPSVVNEHSAGYVITGGKQKIKSGKFAKCNINLVREKAWPHVATLKKYTRRVPFNQLDLKASLQGKHAPY